MMAVGQTVMKVLQIAQIAQLLLLQGVSAQQENTPAPLVLPQSQYWEGNDGEWSTFFIRVGDPQQEVRVLVSTQFPNTIVKINTTCEQGNDSQCANAMGKTFAPNSSETYVSEGIFNLYAELNYTTQYDRAYYGFDSLGFGLNDQQGPEFPGQIIASTNSPNYYLGLFGANPQPTNFTGFSNPIPSLFQQLKNNNTIPSMSYSYTAGAPYRFKKVLGSFIFGGYDSSRIEYNDYNFNMADDVSRDLVVGLQALTYRNDDGTDRPLLNDGIFALVDTTVPFMVLPRESCDLFADRLGLEWDADLELYTVSNAVHNQLSSSGTNFTFQLGNQQNGGSSISIQVPYDAFDLTANNEYTGSGDVRYFPIKPAANDTQYTIGRAFFQEAMVIVNYEQGNFSIAQAIWDDPERTETIEIIRPKGYEWPAASNDGSGSGVNGSSSGGSSNAGTIGGAVGGVLGGLALIGGLLFLAWKKRMWPFASRKTEADELDSRPVVGGPHGEALEAPGKGFYGTEMPGSDGAIHKSELPGSGGQNAFGKQELAAGGVYRPGELNEKHGYSSTVNRGELGGDTGARELIGDDGRREMQGDAPVMELPGSDVPSGFLAAQTGGRSRSSRGSAGSRSRGTTPRHTAAPASRDDSPQSTPRSPLMGGDRSSGRSPARRKDSSGPSPIGTASETSPAVGSVSSPGQPSSAGYSGIFSPVSPEDERKPKPPPKDGAGGGSGAGGQAGNWV